MTISSPTALARNHAGFGKRLAAHLLDLVIIFPVTFMFGVSFQDDPSVRACGNLLSLLVGWLYFAGMESSSCQGTLGKIALGIKVTDLAGAPLSFGQASGRYFAKIVSGLLFGIGYLMIAFTENQQGLHDLMAGCLVVNKK